MDKHTNKDFPEALREIRKKLNIGVPELARKCGFTYSYIYDIENRSINAPKPERIRIIAKALKVNPKYFKEYRYQMGCEYLKINPDEVIRILEKREAPEKEQIIESQEISDEEGA